MVFAHLRSDERIGLGIALALHLALVAVLLVRPEPGPVFDNPERMTVNLSTEVGLEATAPEPVAESRAAIAPELSPQPAPMIEPAPEPAVEPAPAPLRPVVTPQPRPRPVTRVTTPPRPQPSPASTAPRRRPDTPSTRAQSTPAPPRPAGGSRVGADFLAGAGESTTTAETRVPASRIGASARASIVQALARQLKPKWQGRAPDGPDADQLVTILAFRLNENGSLSGTPRVVRQEGINDLNRNQAALHAEAAIKAVQLAAPFDLPAEFYNAWKSIDGARFDRNLSR